jgi:hypothetical protein
MKIGFFVYVACHVFNFCFVLFYSFIEGVKFLQHTDSLLNKRPPSWVLLQLTLLSHRPSQTEEQQQPAMGKSDHLISSSIVEPITQEQASEVRVVSWLTKCFEIINLTLI